MGSGGTPGGSRPFECDFDLRDVGVVVLMAPPQNPLHHITSVPDVLRVERACFVRFVSAFDNGATVFKDGELIGVTVLNELKLEKELVVSHGARLLQHVREVGEV